MRKLMVNRGIWSVIWGILFLNLAFGVTIRVQDVSRLAGQYLTSYDAYLFLRQAKLIEETGGLPKRDMQRYVPVGRDLTQQLSLSSYAMVYLHKLLRLFYSPVSIEQAAIYYPVLCFVLSIVVFFLLVSRLFDKYFSLLATAVFAMVPAIVFQTMVGFADRDALCMLELLLTFYFYIRAWQATMPLKKFVFAGASGIAMGTLGLTWPGIGLLMLVVSTRLSYSQTNTKRTISTSTFAGIRLWRLCSLLSPTDTEQFPWMPRPSSFGFHLLVFF